MEMPKRYDAGEAEPRIQKFWEDSKLFIFDPKSKKPIFSNDTPPRYASGPLHIGHATSYSHQDFFCRYKRMRGFNVFYPLTFDVNGLPIEVNVEKQGITPEKVGRDAFVKACSKFAAKNIKTMTMQFRLLGHSMDPTIYYQTDADYYRRLTQISFIRLFKKDLVYKGEAPVIWCPRCITALADAETEYKTRNTRLNYLKFYIDEEIKSKGKWVGKDDKGYYAVIATTRPELLPACVTVLVNPEDPRYKELVGKELKVPLFAKKIKVITDESVEPEFGTGIMMVCTFGDLTDLEVVRKYDLPFVRALDDKGRLTEVAGKYRGMIVKEARKTMIEDMKKQDLLVEQRDTEQNVSTCWRCSTPIEYIITKEWFLKTLPFKEDVLKASKKIKWHPSFMITRLENWVDSLKWDWCISRRRYLATPLPLWECDKCEDVVLAKEEQCYINPLRTKPPKESCKCGGRFKGSELVFDTWMDSSLTVLFNSYWLRDDKMFKRLFPMDVRPQAHDIIRTWAFYTILRTLQMVGDIPFKNIVLSGYIMGPDGTPMHASKGNVVDPLEVIEKNSADAFRYFAGLLSLGMDTAFKWKDVGHASRLLQKLWNMGRFTSMQLEGFEKKKVKTRAVDKWILAKLAKLIEENTKSWDEYNFSAAMQRTESFLWNTVADNYIEMIKHRLYGEGDKEAAQQTLYTVMLSVVKMLAPVLPHITEEIWQRLFKEFEKEKSIHISSWPKVEKKPELAVFEKAGDAAVSVLAAIRQWKQENRLPLNAEVKKVVIGREKEDILKDFVDDIKGAMKVKEIGFGSKFLVEA